MERKISKNPLFILLFAQFKPIFNIAYFFLSPIENIRFINFIYIFFALYDKAIQPSDFSHISIFLLIKASSKN